MVQIAHPHTKTALALAALAVYAVLSSGAYAQLGTSGTFTDSRDGKTYRTVRIGNLTWMAWNLNFKTERSVCYKNDESNCKKYGRLYDWDDAVNACPAGWRIPTREDWSDLVEAAGDNAAGTKLKSKTGWNGTDDLGFSATPGGRSGTDGNFDNAGLFGFWWSAAEFEFGESSAWRRYMGSGFTYVSENTDRKDRRLSARCVEN
jgi:uncharacterized protein (TIGR02145 family)